MSRPKSDFKIGDKVKHVSDNKSEGVVVHKQQDHADGRQWNVHWHRFKCARGVYTADEIKKYF